MPWCAVWKRPGFARRAHQRVGLAHPVPDCAAMGLYALIMRTRLHERTFSRARPRRRSAVRSGGRRSPPQAGLPGDRPVVGLTVFYYIWGVVAPSYATTALKIDRGEALWAGVIGDIVFIPALPSGGSCRTGSDGRRCCGPARPAKASHFPMTWLLKDSAWQLAVSMSAMLIFIAASSDRPGGLRGAVSTSIRTVGVESLLHLRGGVRRNRAVPVQGPALRCKCRSRSTCMPCCCSSASCRLHHPGNEGQGPHALIRSGPVELSVVAVLEGSGQPQLMAHPVFAGGRVSRR